MLAAGAKTWSIEGSRSLGVVTGGDTDCGVRYLEEGQQVAKTFSEES